MIYETTIVEKDIFEIAHFVKQSLFRLEGKNIVITGATGMLASYIVYVLMYANEHFFEKQANIYLITRNKRKKFGKKKYFHYCYQNITKQLKLPTMHYLIHAASKASPKFYSDNMIDTIDTNILGLYSLLRLCTSETESLLYFSSSEIYGEVKNKKPVNESYCGIVDHLNKRSCYIEAKKAAESIAMNYFWEKGIPIKIARIFHTFGPGMNLYDGRVFSDFIRFGLEKKNILIQGDPSIRRSMLYIKDATIMFLKILLSNRNGEVYNVGSEKNITSIEEFAHIVCNSFNELDKQTYQVLLKKNQQNEYYKNAVKYILPSLKKFKRDFNYQPTTTIEESAQRTIKHFLEFKK